MRESAHQDVAASLLTPDAHAPTSDAPPCSVPDAPLLNVWHAFGCRALEAGCLLAEHEGGTVMERGRMDAAVVRLLSLVAEGMTHAAVLYCLGGKRAPEGRAPEGRTRDGSAWKEGADGRRKSRVRLFMHV